MSAKIMVNYRDAEISNVLDLIEEYDGQLDADRQAVVFNYSEELVEELEKRGIFFRVVGWMW